MMNWVSKWLYIAVIPATLLDFIILRLLGINDTTLTLFTLLVVKNVGEVSLFLLGVYIGRTDRDA